MPAPASPAAAHERRARAAFARYRVAAFVTGGMLLLLTLEIILKYVLRAGGLDEAGAPRAVLGDWIAFVHGWIYIGYLVTVFDLWSRMRWGLARVLGLVVAGVVPVLSFVLEPRAARWVERDLSDAAGAPGSGA